MSTDSAGGRPSTLRLVLVPAIITLAVTGLRLLGEIRDWDPVLFSKEAGGAGAIFGITWLVPIFGLYFGYRLAIAGYGPKQKLVSILAHIAAFALTVGSFFLWKDVVGLEYRELVPAFGATALVCSLIGFAVWPALFRVNLVYGILARIPVVVVTYLAVEKGWNTHYTALGGPDPPDLGQNEIALYLSIFQMTFWVAFTIMAGGVAGSLASLFARRR